MPSAVFRLCVRPGLLDVSILLGTLAIGTGLI